MTDDQNKTSQESSNAIVLRALTRELSMRKERIAQAHAIEQREADRQMIIEVSRALRRTPKPTPTLN